MFRNGQLGCDDDRMVFFGDDYNIEEQRSLVWEAVAQSAVLSPQNQCTEQTRFHNVSVVKCETCWSKFVSAETAYY